MNHLFVLGLLSIIFLAPSEGRAEDGFLKNLERCNNDSECVSATVAWPACNHYCGSFPRDNCTDATALCPAFNKTAPITAVCALNAPCKKEKRTWCESGKCKSE